MHRYRHNARWLTWFAPFRALSISAAYLAPFLQQKGLSFTEILLLQSVFSVAYLLWEIPSGYIADRFGRAFCIKLSAPIAATAMIGYGLSDQFWQFIIWELALALSSGFISGIDTALLIDSLKADGQEHQFVKLSQRMNAFGFGATALGVPVAIALVHFVSIGSTLVADGLLTLVGWLFVLRLVEAPRQSHARELSGSTIWPALRTLARNAEVRWLVVLGAVLSTATYLGFWLSAPYYHAMGIPTILFSAILAVRSLWKAWLSHRGHQDDHLDRNMKTYAVLAGLSYLGMATGQLWLIWLVLGHDIVQALQGQPITAKLNGHIQPQFRATMNSVVNLVQRLVFAVAGPLVGLMIDHTSLSTGLMVTGVVSTGLALLALAKLRQFKTFQN